MPELHETEDIAKDRTLLTEPLTQNQGANNLKRDTEEVTRKLSPHTEGLLVAAFARQLPGVTVSQ